MRYSKSVVVVVLFFYLVDPLLNEGSDLVRGRPARVELISTWVDLLRLWHSALL